jgi:uncharacterized protein (TIGR03067 family)
MNLKHSFLLLGAAVAMAGCDARQAPSAPDRAVVPADSADLAQQEAKALEGTWRTVSVTRPSAEPVKDTRGTITFAGGKMILASPTGEREIFSYRIDALAEPKTLELAEADNTNAPPRFAIYELEGESLRFCFGREGMRPKAFGANERPVFLLQRE